MNLLEARRKASQEQKEQVKYFTDLSLDEQEGEPDIADRLEQQLIAAARNDLETLPRITVLKMLAEIDFDVDFTFKVSLGQGDNYVQAMRQVISRAKKKALKKKIPLLEFKVYQKDIHSEVDHDVVTLLKTRKMREHEESVYDELLEKFSKPVLK